MTRVTWRAKPCGWRDRERVVALGEEFGAAGPLTLDILEELAKEQGGTNPDGNIRTGLRSLARAAFLPRGGAGVKLARDILTFAVTAGAIDNLEISRDTDMVVTCKVSGYKHDQSRGHEAVRKNWQRTEDQDTANGHDRGAYFNGRHQPVAVTRRAEQILEEFNRQARTNYKPYNATGRPTEDLKRILGALINADPAIDLEEAKRMIGVSLANPWWQGKPGTGVIFGPKVVTTARENARRARTTAAATLTAYQQRQATQAAA